MPKVYIALGSNVGDRKSLIEGAVKRISEIQGVSDVTVSPIYETDPVGGPPQGKFLNAALRAECDLSPAALLTELLTIEQWMGRVRTSGKNEPRSIDLDILFYGDRVINEPHLTIPHPRIHERTFVLKPMADIAGDFQHPIFKKTINHLLREQPS